ncbi:PASTA domain-containing protein [Plantactinospora sp. KLBMP9567]|uniref:PASTA domain-containing protein n=1 Tax=Plantactinospora sp. KLBMP9567 TaxID=3085900 RepID=UPI0029823727|nr:PASTA domain-containing protein [Plantactinospora sp. KLBMP9567]MDW5326621.1 PASTA domain-containing protein [Plantactinospora sp. KLBMP9567]
MNAAPARSGWPFLVGRGRDAGYRMLLTPAALADRNDSDGLLAAVTGEVPADAPPVLAVVGPGGALCVVYRTLRPSTADTGATGPGRSTPLLDRAGRPLVLAYGFVCRGARVTRVDEADLRYAREVALDAFRRFHADEAAYRTAVSEPYPLRSEIVGRPAGPAGQARSTAPPGQPRAVPPGELAAAPDLAPAWRTDPLPPPGRLRDDRWRPPALLLGLCALLLVLAGTGLWLATRPPEVPVPGIVGLPEADAVRDLHRAGLRAVPGQQRWGAGCRPGWVAEQFPAAGTRVRERTEVVYVLCVQQHPQVPPVPPSTARSASAP